MGGRAEGKPMMCQGDPFGVPACVLRASKAVLGAVVGDQGEPLLMLIPTCDLHLPIVADYLSATPLRDQTTVWPIDAWDDLLEVGNREFGGVWVQQESA